MRDLGVEPRFQEPESYVRSITLIPRTLNSLPKSAQNVKGQTDMDQDNL